MERWFTLPPSHSAKEKRQVAKIEDHISQTYPVPVPPESETRLRSVPPVATNDTIPQPPPALGMTYAQAVADYEGLVVHHARRHVCPGVELSDLIQEGYLGLFIAADEWRADGGASFGNYATMWIRSRLFAARRRGRRRGMTIGQGARKAADLSSDSLDAVDDDGVSLSELLGTPALQEEALSDAQQAAVVTGAIGALPKHDRELLTMWAVEGLTYSEISKRIGLTWADPSGRGKQARAAGAVSINTISRWTRSAFAGLCELLKARGFEGEVRIDGRRPGKKLADGRRPGPRKACSVAA